MWYRNIRGALEEIGFEQNPYDKCVFNKLDKDGVQVTVAIHVDDLMITSVSQRLVDELENHLRNKYGDITVKDGKVLDYVGMTFDFSQEGSVRITMAHCIEEILATCGVEGTAATPATDNLFNVRDDATPATTEEAIWFHSFTAKMLYVSKRVKPECLVTVSFLSTRVQKCDQDDLNKLRRLLKYLRATKDRGIAIKIGDEIEINCYIDASYGVHMDSGKSHSGLAVVLGEGPVNVYSSKQHINVKSSTEAELVALRRSAPEAFPGRPRIRRPVQHQTGQHVNDGADKERRAWSYRVTAYPHSILLVEGSNRFRGSYHSAYTNRRNDR